MGTLAESGGAPMSRVALFTDSDVFAGTERHILDLARGLRGQNLEPLVVCPAYGALASRAESEGFQILDIPKKGSFDWRAVRTLRRELRAGAIDLIHTHNGRTSMIAAVAVSLAGRGKVVATQHFIAPARAGRRGLTALASRLAHEWVETRTDRFIAISGAVYTAMVARGVPFTKISAVANGIVAPTPAPTCDRAHVRRELGMPPDALIAFCAARLEPEKDVASLVEAMAMVRERRFGVCCIVAGEGSQRGELERRISKLMLGENVRLLGFRKDVPALLGASDMFVLPSLAEPFGLALVEAMALSKPVVATSTGGPLEIVADGETGFLVPKSNPKSLSEAIVRLANDEPLRRRMGNAGYERFIARFTADRMAEQTASRLPAGVQRRAPGFCRLCTTGVRLLRDCDVVLGGAFGRLRTIFGGGA